MSRSFRPSPGCRARPVGNGARQFPRAAIALSVLAAGVAAPGASWSRPSMAIWPRSCG